MNKFIYKKCYLTLLLCSMIFTANASLLDTEFKAHIVDNSCRITVSDGGNITLGIVSINYIQTLTPTQYSGGSVFKITIDECGAAISPNVSKLHFSFHPQSGNYYAMSRQIFWNELDTSDGGAQNVGVVIFSEQTLKNVLSTTGDSDVVFNVNKSTYQNIYAFTARMQKADASFNVGQVVSNVIVDVYYD